MRARVKCALFVYVKHTVHSPLDKFPLPSMYLLFLIVLWKQANDYEHIFMQEEKSYRFDLTGKNMGSTTESHLLCQLFFCTMIFPWERISAARITVRSVRAVSYLDMKEGKMEEGGVKRRGRERERGVERQGSPGNDNTWNSVGGLWNLSHHHFMSRYCTYPYYSPRYILCSAVSFQSPPDWSSRLDSYIVYVCAAASFTACLGILLLVWSFSFIHLRSSWTLLFDSISGSRQVSKSVIAVPLQV